MSIRGYQEPQLTSVQPEGETQSLHHLFIRNTHRCAHTSTCWEAEWTLSQNIPNPLISERKRERQRERGREGGAQSLRPSTWQFFFFKNWEVLLPFGLVELLEMQPLRHSVDRQKPAFLTTMTTRPQLYPITFLFSVKLQSELRHPKPPSRPQCQWIENLFLIVRHITVISQFGLFLRGRRNLLETSAAEAFSGFVCYKVTLTASHLSRVSSLRWGNSVCPNYVLLMVKNKRFIGFLSPRSAIALMRIFFSWRLRLAACFWVSVWTWISSCEAKLFENTKEKTFSKHSVAVWTGPNSMG